MTRALLLSSRCVLVGCGPNPKLSAPAKRSGLPVWLAASLGAVASAAGGAWLDVTTRIAWLSSDPAVAAVDRSGALPALPPPRAPGPLPKCFWRASK